jgi:integrase
MVRQKNTSYRSREHLTIDEVNELIHAAGCRGRHKHRDSILLLMMFRHGLRVSEACDLKWDAVLWKDAQIMINRAKKGDSGTHPLMPDEVEALRELKRIYPNSNYIFAGEQGKNLSVDSVQRIVNEAGKVAKLGIKVHPHMFLHACGYHLVNQDAHLLEIQSYLGHKNIQNTAKYTKLKTTNYKTFEWN